MSERPAWRVCEQQDNKVLLAMTVPATLKVFDGHFPGHPILPGVVQLDWAVQAARAFFSLQGDPLRIEVLKFQAVIEPGAELQLALQYRADTGRVAFEFDSARGRHSSGRLLFRMPAAQ